MNGVTRKDANNHIIPGLFGMKAEKTVVYDAEAVSAQATLNFDNTNATSDLTFTAVPYGAAGNGISVELLDPETEDSALSISVSGNVIVISLATDSNGDITSTAAEVKTAVNADSDASALVTCEDEVAGTGIVEAQAALLTEAGAGRTLFEVTGKVLVKFFAEAVDDLTGSGTIAVGNVDDVDYLIDPEAVTALDTGEFLETNGTSSKILTVSTNTMYLCQNDIRDKIATNTITGSLKYHCFWYPLDDDGNVVATNE